MTRIAQSLREALRLDTLETGNLSDLHRSLSSGNDLSTSHRSSVQMSRSGSFANLSAMSYPSSPTPTETENLRNSAQSHIVSSTTTFLTSNSDSFGDCDSVVSFTGISHSHPLTMAKHICSICGDRASGKHYGVYSCEGCKGFFKRTVRKDLTYGCRENRQCIIDKRQRNRCQYCRYQKCLFMGMKREAVQEERHRLRSDRSDGEPESTSNFMPDMPPNQIYEAELLVDQSHQDQENINVNQLNSSEAVERQIRELVDWARMLPHFMDLSVEDQSLLIHTGWNELILASVAFRSSTDTLLFPCGQRLTSSIARQSGLDDIYERIRTELTAKLRELNVDRTELGCLRAIVLFNPDAVGLKQSASVESCREKVYCCLEEFCRQSYPTEPGRFAKLLLRLPALRSIGIKSLDMSVSLIPPVPTLACLQQLIHSSPQIPHSSDEDFCLF